MTDLSGVVGAVDAEISAIEQRLARLKEIRRLVLELDLAPPPRATVGKAVTASASDKRKASTAGGRKSRLTPEDVIGPVRELLVHGPVTSAEIHRAIGRWPTGRTKAVVEDALNRLGAVQVGVGKGGTVSWDMPVRARISELKEKLGEWTPEEWQYQLRKRFGIDSPIGELRDALSAMNGVGAGRQGEGS